LPVLLRETGESSAAPWAFKRPVFDKARSRAEGKKIRFWRDGWRVFVALVCYRVAE
jgi:hypothetical protein